VRISNWKAQEKRGSGDIETRGRGNGDKETRGTGESVNRGNGGASDFELRIVLRTLLADWTEEIGQRPEGLGDPGEQKQLVNGRTLQYEFPRTVGGETSPLTRRGSS